MGYLYQVKGLDKSGKTATAVVIAQMLINLYGARAFTNMYGTIDRNGNRWAEHVELDDLLDDVQRPLRGAYAPDGRYHPKDCECSAEHAWITDGIFILDEAHVLLDWRNQHSKAAGYLQSFMLQAGKRNLPIVFTSHSVGQIQPTIRQLTSVIFDCKENYENGKVILVDAYDPNKLDTWQAEKGWATGKPRPIRYWKFYPRAVFGLYDHQESISILSFARSKYAGRGDKVLMKQLQAERQAAGAGNAEAGDVAKHIQVAVDRAVGAAISTRPTLADFLGGK